MKTTDRLAILLPAYNEELTIRDTILDFYRKFPKALIVVINNNSKDKTESIAAATFKEFKVNGKIINETRQGKAFAVRTAFHEIEADIYVMSDADCTYQASDLNHLIDSLVNESADMIVGDRHHNGAYKNENKRKFHYLGNMLVKWFINTLFQSKLNDIMSGYRVFNRKFVKTYPILCKGFELETEMTLHALDKGFKVKEERIVYKDRPTGSFSKLNTFKDGIKVLKTIIWIFKFYKPFHFFGYLSLSLFFAGLFSAYPVFKDYYLEKYIYHIPLAILATGLMITSLISLSIGLILDTSSRFHKFDFELYLLNYKDDKGDGRK
ncbi:glycosyltransferase family 2 protein [Leptospira ilyithenensis]|uniref:Glycosyltransferase n=1 Tax=Leptospira ilyithenensis TaxID=2484901 RepID=A0A4V6QMR8_9LEPT|nr:glycosyltransferase family 2 protein [Leptospira ilyithenensis]TGN08038.1 glycosyltransferase [Leptospira ilyithenensis]